MDRHGGHEPAEQEELLLIYGTREERKAIKERTWNAGKRSLAPVDITAQSNRSATWARPLASTCLTPGLLEVIPLAPLVATRRPAVALTGFLSCLALGDLLAVPSDVLEGQACWVVPESLGQLGT